mgnify:CR=1 FL=1
MTATGMPQEPNGLTTGAFLDANGVPHGSYYGEFAGIHFGEFGSLRATVQASAAESDASLDAWGGP